MKFTPLFRVALAVLYVFARGGAVFAADSFYVLLGAPGSQDAPQTSLYETLSDFRLDAGAGPPHATRPKVPAATSPSLRMARFTIFRAMPSTREASSSGCGPLSPNFLTDTDGHMLGTRPLGAGIGFEISPTGTVYFLDTESSPESATSASLYSWASLSDFVTNTNGSTNGGAFTLPNSGPVAGIGVIPEPTTSALLLMAMLAGAAGCRCSRRR